MQRYFNFYVNTGSNAVGPFNLVYETCYHTSGYMVDSGTLANLTGVSRYALTGSGVIAMTPSGTGDFVNKVAIVNGALCQNIKEYDIPFLVIEIEPYGPNFSPSDWSTFEGYHYPNGYSNFHIQLNGFDVYYGALNLRNIFSINNNQSSSRQLFIGLTGFLNISTDGNDVPQIANLSVPTYSSYPNSGIPSQYVNHSGSPSPYDVNVLEWSSTDMSRTGFLISIAKGYLSGDFYGVYHVRYSSIVVSGAPSTNYITGNSNTFSF